MITSFTPKKSFCFFWGRSMGVSVTSITVTTSISAWFSRAFFPFKRKFPDCQSIFSVLFTIRPIVDSDSWPLVPMWKYVLYSRQYSNVTKTVIIFAYGILKCLLDKTFRTILRIFYQYRPRFHTETRRADSLGFGLLLDAELESASTLLTDSTIFLYVCLYTLKRRLNCSSDKFW